MISIDSYRARIGLFQTRRSKQAFIETNPYDFCHKANESENPVKVKLTMRLVLCLSIISIFVSSSPCGVLYQTANISGGLLGFKSCKTFSHIDRMENNTNCSQHPSVIEAQLIIGNVEMNPGPVSFKEFLGFLFVEAKDVDVKNVLQEVKAGQDKPMNLRKIKTKKVESLKAAFVYLSTTDENEENGDDIAAIQNDLEEYTKDGIAHKLIKKIYNMAPEVCSSCRKTYYFKRGESCSLACIRCNRGACRDCYDKEKENLASISMFNRNIFFVIVPKA